ncbi:MAG: hypothetical protein IKG25_05720 [Mogibacterium sp.]|nr:hypothetical protein [Mogibacterium sp.]MBR4090392.1 hypothetical protein [Mogibacterium sp.]
MKRSYYLFDTETRIVSEYHTDDLRYITERCKEWNDEKARRGGRRTYTVISVGCFRDERGFVIPSAE